MGENSWILRGNDAQQGVCGKRKRTLCARFLMTARLSFCVQARGRTHPLPSTRYHFVEFMVEINLGREFDNSVLKAETRSTSTDNDPH